MTKRGLSFDGVPKQTVAPSYRSEDRSDLPARVGDALQLFEEVHGRKPTVVHLGRKEMMELHEIIMRELPTPQMPVFQAYRVAGLPIAQHMEDESRLEVK
jgi:hypothetical protein